MNTTFKRVTQFHRVFNHPISECPTVGTAEFRQLRARMILEEVGEVLQALGFNAEMTVTADEISINLEGYKQDSEVDLVKVAKELSDLDYVTQGANVGLGLPSEAVAQATHKSNMSKVGPDGKPQYREDGKVLKGPNYSPAEPDIEEVLACCNENPRVDLLTRSMDEIKYYRATVMSAEELQHHAV